MSVCSRCGNSVEFRYVNGRCIPLHLNGSCLGYGSSIISDYSGYSTCSDSACFATSCPICSDKVYFIRHNGGSVWIDPPLGPPWVKHACFYDTSVASEKTSLAEHYKISLQDLQDKNLNLGVAKSTNVYSDKTKTKVVLVAGEYETIFLDLKNNAGYLLGRLCVVDEKSGFVWPIDSPIYLFKVLSYKKISNEPVKCPQCGVEVFSKNLRKHQKKQHPEVS